MKEDCQSSSKGEEIIPKDEEKTDKLSVKDLFEKDITYNDLPEPVKEYFQQYIDSLSRTIRQNKSRLETIQGLKNAFTSGYIRDVLLGFVVKTEEQYRNTEKPNEWVHQINPTIFTKIKQMIDTNHAVIKELCDTEGFEGNDFKLEEITFRKIMKQRKAIKEDEKEKEIVIDADFEVMNDDTN